MDVQENSTHYILRCAFPDGSGDELAFYGGSSWGDVHECREDLGSCLLSEPETYNRLGKACGGTSAILGAVLLAAFLRR